MHGVLMGGLQTLPKHGVLTPSFRPLVGIKELQEIRFTSAEPGVVYFKKYADNVEKFVLLKPGTQPPSTMPHIVPSPGLDSRRQWYLFDKICDFCSESTRDLTCPGRLATVTGPRVNQGDRLGLEVPVVYTSSGTAKDTTALPTLLQV